MDIAIFVQKAKYVKFPQYKNKVAVVKATVLKNGNTFEATGVADEIMDAEDLAVKRALDVSKLTK